MAPQKSPEPAFDIIVERGMEEFVEEKGVVNGIKCLGKVYG